MKIKASELSGAALDWAATKAVYESIPTTLPFDEWLAGSQEGNWSLSEEEDLMLEDLRGFKPSSRWADGGPIIEREGILLLEKNVHGEWVASAPRGEWRFVASGKSPLIAAMRSFVAARLGEGYSEMVEIPNARRFRAKCAA